MPELSFDPERQALGLVTSNPVAGIVKYSKTPERPRTKIPLEAIRALFPPTHGELVRIWGSSMWAAALLVILDTGARPGEVRALKWSGYYPDERFIPFRHGIEAGTSATIKGTKTGTIRPGFVQVRTAQELAIWRSESRYFKETDWIFTVDGKAPVSDNAVKDAFRRALACVGYEGTDWTPYYLRHSFISYAMAVLDDAAVQLLAGHTNLQTNAIYRHPDDAIILERSRHLRDILDKVRGETNDEK